MKWRLGNNVLELFLEAREHLIRHSSKQDRINAVHELELLFAEALISPG